MRYASALRIFSSVLALQAMTACSEKILETPGIHYTNSGPIALNVQEIGIISIPETSLSKNKQAQKAAVLLRAEIEKWARSRFSAQGGEDRAVITVGKATIKVLRDTKAGYAHVRRDFYEGKVDVKLEILDSRGFVKGSASSSVVETIGIPETYTYHERKAQVKRLREELVNATDAKIVKEVSQNLTLYMIEQEL